MLVCHCKGMNERAVRRVVRAGARCVSDVTRTCGAGGVCGGCRPVIQDIVEAHESEAAPDDLGLDFAAAR